MKPSSNFLSIPGLILFSCLFADLLFGDSSPRLLQCDVVSIRQAIAEGGELGFACDGSIVLTEPFQIDRSVTLDANGHSVILDGAGQTRVFNISKSGSLTLKGLRITRGNATEGGAILINGGALHLVNCTFETNQAVGLPGLGFSLGSPGYGGAIRATNAEVSCENCIFSSNVALGGVGGPQGIPGSPAAQGNAGSGGGLFMEAGSAVFKGCSFLANQAKGGPGAPGILTFERGMDGAAYGGALFLSQKTQGTLQGCEFKNNSAVGGSASGGAIHIDDGTMEIQSSRIDSNRSTSTSSFAQGGGVSVAGETCSMSDVQIVGNVSDSTAFSRFPGGPESIRGGGLFVGIGKVDLKGCLVAGNQVIGAIAHYSPAATGGGLALGGGVYNAGTLLTDSTAFLGNVATGGAGGVPPGTAPLILFSPGGNGQGGALYSSAGANASALNTTFANNVARGPVPLEFLGQFGGYGSGMGSAIYDASSLLLRFCTVAQNNSEVPAIFTGDGTRLEASLVASNSPGPNFSGKVVDLGHNLSSDASALLEASGSLTSVDPHLLPLRYNGGRIPTIGLETNSPAIDAATVDQSPLTDGRGRPRPYGKASDIGAYEWTLDVFWPVSVRKLAEEQIGLSGLGVSGKSFSVEASEDWVQWISAQSGIVSPSGQWEVAFPLNRTQGNHLFRVRAVE